RGGGAGRPGRGGPPALGPGEARLAQRALRDSLPQRGVGPGERDGPPGRRLLDPRGRGRQEVPVLLQGGPEHAGGARPAGRGHGLTYGCGWGKPPHSVIVKVSRLGALGGIPGSGQGRVELVIPAEDRDEARNLVESIRGPAPLDWGRARRGGPPPAPGLLAAGAAGRLRPA